MFTKNHTRSLAIIVILLVATYSLGLGVQPPSADEIMQSAKDRWQGEDFTSSVKLTTTEQGGGVTEISAKFQAKLIEESRATQDFSYKVLTRVLEPEDVRDLAVLIHEQAFPVADDIWLYLPALQSTRKIALEDLRNPLFGSEFVFEDIIGREPEFDSHEIVNEDVQNGNPVWIIKSTPFVPDLAGFAYRITTIDQNSYIDVRMELYDSNDKLIKLYQAQQVREIQGISTWTLATAENFETGRTTTFEFLDPAYDTDISDNIFEPENLDDSGSS
jgi:hypothetical protein